MQQKEKARISTYGYHKREANVLTTSTSSRCQGTKTRKHKKLTHTILGQETNTLQWEAEMKILKVLTIGIEVRELGTTTLMWVVNIVKYLINEELLSQSLEAKKVLCQADPFIIDNVILDKKGFSAPSSNALTREGPI